MALSLHSEVQVEQVWKCPGGSLYLEVQYIMDNGHTGPPAPVDRQIWHDWKHCLPATSLAGGEHVTSGYARRLVTMWKTK